jgi:ABC-2 type transport system permease protein
MRLVLHQVRMEQLVFWRNREAAVFVFVFPPLLFLLLGALYDGTYDGYPAADLLVAGLIGYGCVNTAFGGLAIQLVVRRENGLLKRLRATPLPTRTYLVAVVTSVTLVFAAQMILTIVLGVTLYDARGAESWLWTATLIPLGVTAFAGLGFGAAALVRSSDGVSAVVNLAILPMAFLSGAFGPTQDYPAVLRAIGDVLPLTYFVDLVEDAYLRGQAPWHDLLALGILAAWAAAGYVVAATRFQWMPRER